MTKGEATMLETDVVIFPMDSNRHDQEIIKTTEGAGDVSVKRESVKSNLEDRFLRLKKSLRKRSVSIL